MLNKTDTQRLDAVRAELVAVETGLTELAAAKGRASASADAFARWRQECEAKTAERERLLIQVEALEIEIAAAVAASRDAEMRRQHAALKIVGEKLAQRIQLDIEAANNILLPLIRDVAQFEAEIRAINSSLPAGLEAIVSPDQLARAKPALPREDIGREKALLWTRAEDGGIVGDQQAVRVLRDGTGEITLYNRHPVKCVQRKFEIVEHRPAEPAERARPLWNMVLVRPNAPGTIFDGADLQPREILAALDRATAPRDPRARSIEREIRPIDNVKPAN
jgi:hypothetical protein